MTEQVTHTETQGLSEELGHRDRELPQADASVEKAKRVFSQNGVVMTPREDAESQANPDAYKVEGR